MKHDINVNTYYILKDVKYSKMLLNELKEQFPNLRWFSGTENDGKYLSGKKSYVVDKTDYGISCLTYSSSISRSPIYSKYKIINYPPDTIQEKIKKLKI